MFLKSKLIFLKGANFSDLKQMDDEDSRLLSRKCAFAVDEASNNLYKRKVISFFLLSLEQFRVTAFP